jgi:hypothetical protein
VDFGGTAGTGLTVDPSGGLATVTSPAHTAGPAPVTITTPAGTSAAETFTFEAPLPPGGPVVVAVIPGAARPGATIQIVGTNLTDATVTMCGETVAIVSNDGTIITVVVPPGCPDGPRRSRSPHRTARRPPTSQSYRSPSPANARASPTGAPPTRHAPTARRASLRRPAR